MEPSRPSVVVLDGEIGAGKTTLLRILAAELRRHGRSVAVVEEPVEDWKRVGILQDFYAGGATPGEEARTAYAFQTYVFVTRVLEAQKAALAAPEAEIVLLERSIFTDRYVFVELMRDLLGPQQVEMYAAWWGLWSQVMPYEPGLFVYLKPQLGRCMARVAARAREGEVAPAGKKPKGGVSAEYQRRLRRAHEAFLQGQHGAEFPATPPFPGRQVCVLEGALADDDFAHDPAAAGRIAREVFGRLGLEYAPHPAGAESGGAV
jgi:deoxyadenosine/deoxycytidine kinase